MDADNAVHTTAPTSQPLTTTPLLNSNPLVVSSDLTTALPSEPAYSLRQFTFAQPSEYPPNPISVPMARVIPDQGMAFTFDMNGGSVELPNELFRIDQNNPFFSMPSTYNLEDWDWDVWMEEQGVSGPANNKEVSL